MHTCLFWTFKFKFSKPYSVYLYIYFTCTLMAGILKDADELKDYIKNLGIEYRFSCYSEKNPQG